MLAVTVPHLLPETTCRSRLLPSVIRRACRHYLNSLYARPTDRYRLQVALVCAIICGSVFCWHRSTRLARGYRNRQRLAECHQAKVVLE